MVCIENWQSRLSAENLNLHVHIQPNSHFCQTSKIILLSIWMYWICRLVTNQDKQFSVGMLPKRDFLNKFSCPKSRSCPRQSCSQGPTPPLGGWGWWTLSPGPYSYICFEPHRLVCLSVVAIYFCSPWGETSPAPHCCSLEPKTCCCSLAVDDVNEPWVN